MNKNDLLKEIQSNISQGEDCTIREKRQWEYDVPYKCVFSNVTKFDGRFYFEIAICTSELDEEFCRETFCFTKTGAGARYLDNFLKKALPNQDQITASSVIGKTFIGQIVKQGEFKNLVALDTADAQIFDETSIDGFEDATEDFLQFSNQEEEA